jgi:3-dehydroquinate synthase
MELKPIVQSFSVPFTYKLFFTAGIFEEDNPLFLNIITSFRSDGPVKLLFVIDGGVAAHHPQLVSLIRDYCDHRKQNLAFTEALVVEGGENSKNDESSFNRVLEAINKNSICRHSFVVVIGGGAVIDMAGYAAAIAHRGVKLIRVPTTVLSQNDAAVGVKNSVNLFGKKNFIGTFAPPFAIINDSNFLSSLEQRDWIAGVAEAIKVSLIRDADFFNYISAHTEELRLRKHEVMQRVIYRCAEMHMEHIAMGGDPFESGSSRPLDFGHWAAHKLENMSGYRLRHGEAVAKGMALDVMYAYLRELISYDVMDKILSVMEELGLHLDISLKNESEIDELLDGIQEFREHLGGELTITLLSGIGMKHDVHEIDREMMKEAIQRVNDRSKLNVA